jgi:hypothetical protein
MKGYLVLYLDFDNITEPIKVFSRKDAAYAFLNEQKYPFEYEVKEIDTEGF